MNCRRLLLLGVAALLAVSIPASFINCTCPAAPASSTASASKATDLLAGAKWQFSADGGKTFTDAQTKAQGDTVLARAEFNVADPAVFGYLELAHTISMGTEFGFKLNDKPVAGPLEGMFYRVIPAIDANLLKKGANTLTAEVFLGGAAAVIIGPGMAQLRGLTDKDLAIQTGPMLGAFGDDYFSVTLRTNIPAVVTLTAEPTALLFSKTRSDDVDPPIVVTTEKGLFHRIRLNHPARQIGFKLSVTATAGETKIAVPSWDVSFPTPEKNGKQDLHFVCFGDSRTNVKDWTKVAAAVEKAKPQFTVFVGDMITDGRNDSGWDSEWFGPAKDLLRTVPTMAIFGNHEHNASILDQLFYAPGSDGKARNWAQQIGSVLFVGIDGGQDWSQGGDNAKWLDKTLGDSKAKFIIIASHYPIYTSGGHGALGEDGKLKEKAVRQGQEVILPILNKHKVSLFIAGHDHVYERSELPGGLPSLILGGAGAPLYNKGKDAAKQNPYSKVFESVLHYGLLEVKGDTMSYTAVKLDGTKIDSLEIKARAGR